MTLLPFPPRFLSPRRLGRGAPWARTVTLLGLAAVLLAVTACSGGEPEGPTPEQLAAEQQAKAAPEPPPPPPPPPEPGMSPDEAKAILEPKEKPPVTEESIPEFRYLEGEEGKGTQGPKDQLAMVAPGEPGAATAGPVRIAVLHGPGQEQAAIGVATVIDTYQNEKLSKAVGRPLKVAYVSRVAKSPRPDNLVRYREGLLKAALQLATVLPGDQTVEPMSKEDAAQTPVDVVIYLGANVK